MKNKKLVALVAMIVSTSAFSKIVVHDAVSFSNTTENTSQSNTAEVVHARGRDMSLPLALDHIVPRMNVIFVAPSLKNLSVSWRADSEHYNKVLTRLSRQYPIDIVINESSESIYIDIDNGQCTVPRERKLSEISEAWQQLNITDRPILPPELSIQADLAGYLTRLC